MGRAKHWLFPGAPFTGLVHPLLRARSHCAAQTDLRLLGFRDLSASVSQGAGTTGMCHGASFYFKNIMCICVCGLVHMSAVSEVTIRGSWIFRSRSELFKVNVI